MRRKYRSRVPILLLIVLVAGGCTLRRETRAEKMYILGAALTKLSAAVEATVRYENPPEGIGDAKLLGLATEHDPGLLAPFADYTVRPLRQDGHAIVLVCDKEGKFGLLEDAGCSSPMDRHLWNEVPPKPCEFTIKVETACAGPVQR